MYLYGVKSMDQQTNPLQKYYRQPKIYLTLPSKGKYYPQGSLDFLPTGEHPVYPMTAKDELSFKTPDALLNGQATVDVIQSCIPSIKNAWDLPTLDLDAVLIAIRIATFGEQMDMNINVPNTDIEKGFSVDLRILLGQFGNIDFEDTVQLGQFTVKLKPLTYKDFTDQAMKSFEEQRVFALVNDQSIEEEQKLAVFRQSFKKLTELNIGTVVKSIQSIEVDGETVTDRTMIEDFVANCEQSFFKGILDHLDSQKKKFQIQPMQVQADEEEIAQGAPETFDVPIVFDQAHFFA